MRIIRRTRDVCTLRYHNGDDGERRIIFRYVSSRCKWPREYIMWKFRLRAYPGFIAIRDGWQYTYILSVDSGTALCAIVGAAVLPFIFLRGYAFTSQPKIRFRNISRARGARSTALLKNFESRKLMPEVVNNSRCDYCCHWISIMDIMKRRCKRRSFINAMMHYRGRCAEACY